jgi:hypothetical protein
MNRHQKEMKLDDFGLGWDKVFHINVAEFRILLRIVTANIKVF